MIAKQLIAAFGFWAAMSVPAIASNFSVDPIRLDLNQGNSSTMLVVRNNGSEPLRIALSSYHWSESVSGVPTLVPTDDIIAYPELFELPPHQAQRIRIGADAPSGEREIPYRILIDELPQSGPAGTAKGTQILIRTRISIPLFVAPVNSTSALNFTNLRTFKHAAEFDVINNGTVHVHLDRLALHLHEASGHVTNLDEPGWYVLAGQTRTFRLPTTSCVHAQSAELESHDGATAITADFPTIQTSCDADP